MNNIKTIIDKYDIRINRYEEKNKIKIIDTDKGKYILKEKKDDYLYKYLSNKQFNYYLEHEILDNYNIFPYVQEEKISKQEKGIDLVYILSILHNKTLYYQEIVLDNIKKQYEELNERIDDINKYYFQKQDIIEQKVYMAPEEYLLIRNVSLVYSALTFAKNKLKEWYDYKIIQKKERVVLLHNKPCIEHLLIDDKKQLISWEDYRRDIPIYDFLYLYKTNYQDLEMSSLFNIYQSKFPYTKDEYLLFLVLISLPEKVEFTNHHYHDTEKVYDMVRYLDLTRDFLSKENKEYKSKDENKFEE